MFNDFSHSFYYSILILGAFISVLFIRRLNQAERWIAILLIITLLNELVAQYFKSILKIGNNPVYQITTIFDFLLFARVYALYFQSKFWTRSICYLAIFFIVSAIINLLFFQPFNTSNTNVVMLENLILIFLSLSLFGNIRSNLEYNNLFTESIFWFNSGVIICFAITLPIWGFHSIKVYENEHPPRVIYSILRYANGLMYLVFTLAIILSYLKGRKIASEK